MARKVVSISLDDETYNLLEKLVKKRRSSISGVVREMIYRTYLEITNEEKDPSMLMDFSKYLSELINSVNSLRQEITLLKNIKCMSTSRIDKDMVKHHLGVIQRSVMLVDKNIGVDHRLARQYLGTILKHVQELKKLIGI